MKSATLLSQCLQPYQKVSIHALNEECDGLSLARIDLRWSFNPHTQWRVRLIADCMYFTTSEFQSTHSMKSATQRKQRWQVRYRVSIHALNEECDTPQVIPCHIHGMFQSTHSMKSATTRSSFYLHRGVSIHALNEECDRLWPWCFCSKGRVSIHALNEECDIRLGRAEWG